MPTDRSQAERYLCRCLKVTEKDVLGMVMRGECRTPNDVMDATSAGSGCTACQRRICGMMGRMAE